MEMYEVGGCVRDEIIGVPSKDIDFTVVMGEQDRWIQDSAFYNDPFMCMSLHLQRMGFEIFLETPEYLTIRARFPKHSERSRLTADFVLARKEGEYTDGRRPDKVEPGELIDDLRRRDFTMNAIAKAPDGSLIDPFGGQGDIKAGVIRCVGAAQERFAEDALRAVRALRFSITKDFAIAPDVEFAMQTFSVLHAIRNKISDERIQDELNKALAFDTVKTIKALCKYPFLRDEMFAGKVSLEATMKQRKK